MARAKQSISTVDLTRTIKASQAAGLTITSAHVEPDGTFTLGYGAAPAETDPTPDDALAQWQERRRAS